MDMLEILQNVKAISASDLPKGFDPIPDLKPGDKVRAKSEKYNIYKTSSGGNVIIVHRVGNFTSQRKKGESLDDYDFTALFDDETDDGAYIEFAFDSRRFERVED